MDTQTPKLRLLLCSTGCHRFAELIPEDAEILMVRVEPRIFQIAPILSVVEHFVFIPRETERVHSLFMMVTFCCVMSICVLINQLNDTTE